MEPLLSIKGICKTFSGVAVNDNINIDIMPGEIHALLGENGAGKTTLMNCLFGLYEADLGEFIWRGKRAEIKDSKDAIALGIGMVHQHFMLIQNFSVLENMILGTANGHGPMLQLDKARKELTDLMQQYSLTVDLDAQVWQLPVGVQQRVEIIKALYRGAELLILDEPTAVLTPQETHELFKVLNQLRQEGHSIIIITHKLNEVMEISDRITVLRLGKVVGSLLTKHTSTQEIASLMVGHDLCVDNHRSGCELGPVLMQVEKLCCLSDKQIPALRNVSFQLHGGEILGIAGVSGNGQTELAEVLAGMRPATRGSVTIAGKDVTNASPRALFQSGLSYIPEDRHRDGLVLDFSIQENCITGQYFQAPFSTKGILNRNAIAAYSESLVKTYDVRTSSTQIPVRVLSGGNQQKIILGREINKAPKIYVAVQPTRGMDIGATESIHALLMREREKGCGIIYISTELDEIFKMCDRIFVLFEGMQIGPFPNGTVDIQTIGLMMSGAYADSTREGEQGGG